MAGSAVAGAISMATGCLLRAPHGGIIPNAMSILLLGVLKRPVETGTLASI